MIDFPITELFDDSLCLLWLERHLHPDGFVCPHCGSADRRTFRVQGHYDAYRCRACDGYYTLLSGTASDTLSPAAGHAGALAPWHHQG
ncbi:MAG TPA: transposase [Roseiflexaceae bacterium]|nr:transposase [Roseiflexaceae bacterium]